MLLHHVKERVHVIDVPRELAASNLAADPTDASAAIVGEELASLLQYGYLRRHPQGAVRVEMLAKLRLLAPVRPSVRPPVHVESVVGVERGR